MEHFGHFWIYIWHAFCSGAEASDWVFTKSEFFAVIVFGLLRHFSKKNQDEKWKNREEVAMKWVGYIAVAVAVFTLFILGPFLENEDANMRSDAFERANDRLVSANNVLVQKNGQLIADNLHNLSNVAAVSGDPSGLKKQFTDAQYQVESLRLDLKISEDHNNFLQNQLDFEAKMATPRQSMSLAGPIVSAPGGIATFGQSGGNNTIVTKSKWDMTDSQLADLTKRMRPFTSYIDSDFITAISGDTDGGLFAEKLVVALRAAGWVVPNSGVDQAMFSGVPVGIIIKAHSRTSRPPGFEAFVQSLNEADITPILEVNNELPENKFQVIIGARPSP